MIPLARTVKNYLTLSKVRIANVHHERLGDIRHGDPGSVRIIPSEPLNAPEKKQFAAIERALQNPAVHREITSDIIKMGALFPGDRFVLKQVEGKGEKDLLCIGFPSPGVSFLEIKGERTPLNIPPGDCLLLLSTVTLARSNSLALAAYLSRLFPRADLGDAFFSIENQGMIVEGENGPEVSRPASEKGVLLDADGRFSAAWINNEAEGFQFDYHVHPGLDHHPSKPNDFLSKMSGDIFDIPKDYESFAPQLVFDRIGRCSLHAPKIYRPFKREDRLAMIRDFYNAFFLRARVTGFELA